MHPVEPTASHPPRTILGSSTASRGRVVLPALLASVLLGTMLSPSRGEPAAAQATGYRIIDTWQSADVDLPTDSWRRATGVDIGSDDHIYLVDAGERRLSRIAPDGTASVLGAPDGSTSGLRDASHLAVDVGRNRIYVTDPEADAVAVFDLSGERVATWSGIADPQGIAIGPEGWVAVGAAEPGEMVVFEPDGTERDRFSTTSSTETGDLIRGVDVGPDGRIYVLDGQLQAMRVYNISGRRLDVVSLGIPDRIEVRDVAIDHEPDTSPVVRYRFATSIGLYTHRENSTNWDLVPRGDLHAVAVHSDVGVVVTQPATRRNEGSRILRFPYPALGSAEPDQVWGRSVALPGALDQPEVIAIGADDTALILDRAWRVQRFSREGEVIDQLDAPALTVNPVAAATAPDGTRFVTDGGTLVAHDEEGGELWQTSVAIPGQDGNALAMVFDTNRDEVLVLDGLGERIHRFQPDGMRIGDIALTSAPDGSTIWGDFAIDGSGAAYVLDRINRSVLVIEPPDPMGRRSERVVALPARARHLAVTREGVILTIDRDGWVRRYGPDGASQGAFDATRFDLALNSAPSDVAVHGNGVVYVTDRAANVITRFAPDPSAPPQMPPDDTAECRSFPDKTADPDRLQLGNEVTVRLTVRGGCGSAVSSEPRDILLVLDRSGSMSGEPIRILREAVLAFVADVDFETTRVGVIAFAEDATRAAPLSDDPARVRQAIRGLNADGRTVISTGLAEARQEFQARGRSDVGRVLILFSDGQETGGDTGDTMREAGFLKLVMEVEIFAVGIQASPTLLRRVASDEDHYFAAGSARFLFAVFERIAERVTTTTLFREISVEDEIPANMELIPGSAEPPADQQGRVLRWTLIDVPFNGFGLRYRLRPTAAGQWPTNVYARGEFTDGFGRAGSLDFPVPMVDVYVHTPTPTSTATSTPSPTPTTTPTATATPIPEPIFVPVALRERPCQPGERHADVLLVLDTSSSMQGAKIAAARDAARLFVTLLDLPRDQVGIVSFDADARLVVPLSGDADRILNAIDGLRTNRGTRIDLGLERAMDELSSARRRPDNTPTLVLLTDGRMPDPSDALQLAEDARDRGIRVYAIGLGARDDVDLPVLIEIAGDRARAFLAPDPGDLADIYAQVAGEVPCPPDVYWGGRLLGEKRGPLGDRR